MFFEEQPCDVCGITVQKIFVPIHLKERERGCGELNMLLEYIILLPLGFG